MKHQVYLGLGSNLGNREQHILDAYKEIEKLIGTIQCQSAFFYSEPWGFASQHAFVNTVIRVETVLTPQELLKSTQHIERLLGKRRQHATDRRADQPRYHDRPIDIDILLYDDLTVDEPNLKIPHPLMHKRPFVMEPLKEILCKD